MTACKARPPPRVAERIRASARRDKLPRWTSTLRPVARRGARRLPPGGRRPAFGQASPGDDDEFAVHRLAGERSLAGSTTPTSSPPPAPVPFRLTVPGGAQVADRPAVTMVAVRRRTGGGACSADDGRAARRRRAAGRAARRAHRVARPSIYGRFGYGLATFSTRWALGVGVRRSPAEHRRRCGSASSMATPPCDVARAGLRRRRRNAARRRGDRAARVVRAIVQPPAASPGARFTVVHDGPTTGAPTASPATAWTSRWPGGDPRHDAREVIDLFAVDAEVETALWQFLVDIDLVGDRARRSTGRSTTRCGGGSPIPAGSSVDAGDRPPAGYGIVDRRRRARRARTYASDDHLVVELTDRSAPPTRAAGRSTARATAPRFAAPTPTPTSRCRRPSSARSTSVACRRRRCAAAGRITERSRARSSGPTASSPSHPAPWCGTHF